MYLLAARTDTFTRRNAPTRLNIILLATVNLCSMIELVSCTTAGLPLVGTTLPSRRFTPDFAAPKTFWTCAEGMH